MSSDDLVKRQTEHAAQLIQRSQAAMDLLESGRVPEALSEFESVIAAFPYLQVALLGRALALLRMGRLAEAIRFVSELTVQYPDYENAKKLRHVALCGTDPSRPLLQTALEFVRRYPAQGEIRKAICGRSSKTELEVAIVKGVTLQGTHGLLVAQGDIKLCESTIWENIDHVLVPILQRATPPPAELRPGEYLPLYGLWADNFYHWMMEWLPKVVIAESLGFQGKYVLRPGKKYQTQSLDLLGVTADRIVEFNEQDWVAETLWVVPSTPGAHLHLYRGIFEELRERLLERSGANRTATPGKRIYLSRKNINRPRRVRNEAAVMAIAAPHGFEEVDTETLPLTEQIRLFGESSAVIGPTGAGMLHTLFMRPRSYVLELFGPGYVNPVAYRTAELLKHHYFMIPSYQNEEMVRSGGHGDFDAFVEIIRITLENELGRERHA